MIDQHLEAWLRNVIPGAFQKIVSVALILTVGLLVIKVAANLVRKALLRSKLEKAAHSMIIGVVRVLLYVLLNGLINAFFFPLIKAVRRDA